MPWIRLPAVSESHFGSARFASSAVSKAAKKLRETAARIAAAALQGEPLPNVVNNVP